MATKKTSRIPRSQKEPASKLQAETTRFSLASLQKVVGDHPAIKKTTRVKKNGRSRQETNRVRHLKHKLPGVGGIVEKRALVAAAETEHGMPVVEVGPTLTAGTAPGAGGATSFTDQGGAVLANVHVQLIFWGKVWSGNATPSASDITNAVANILAGPYMSALSQYRGIGSGLLRGTTMVTSSDPPNPFADSDVSALINNLIEDGSVPEPDDDSQLLYCVIMPVGVKNTSSGFVGEHTFFTYTDYDFPFDFDSDNAHFAWVTNNGTLDSVTTIFSHELVESATDPEGSAILGTPGTCSQSGWCEIGDVCSTTGRLNGVLVQSYWSQRDGACIVPTGLPRWSSLGGAINGGLSALRNADGRLEVFTRGSDGALWHIWQTAPNNGWSGWTSLSGWITGRNAAARNADGRLEVFVRGGDGALWHIWQTARNNGWSSWSSLGGGISELLCVGQNADGRLEVFAQGLDGALWHIWQTAPNNGWSGWNSLGGRIRDLLAVNNNADGRLEVFAKGLDGALWHIWQTAPNNGWSGWNSLGGTILDLISVGRNADGRLEVFVRALDSSLYHIWQTAPNNGWSGWSSLGGLINDVLAVSNNADGRLEVFTRGTDNALWHIWQTARNNGWSGWDFQGGLISDLLAVTNNADGRLEVFVRGTDNALWHIWQTAPSNGWNV